MRSSNPVLAALAQARAQAAPLFARWCELNGAPFCPARPADVARFVSGCSALGAGQLCTALQEISKLHTSLGLADPTLGEPVAGAFSETAGIPPPRSWPDEHKRRFRLLPYDLQLFVSSHEARREKVLRRAQNDAATARRNLASGLPVPAKAKQEVTTDETATKAAGATDQATARRD
jgi:hypothetical protein